MNSKIKKHKNTILGLIISAIFIVLIFYKIDLDMLAKTFQSFNYKVLLIFIPLYVLVLYIKGIRWNFLLFDSMEMTPKEGFFSFTVGNTLNSYLPARAGDFYRAVHLGKKLGISKMKLLGSIILERIIDGITVLSILFFAILQFFQQEWVLNIAYLSAAIFVGSLLFLFYLVKFKRVDKIFKKLLSIKFLKRFEDKIQKLFDLTSRFMTGFSSLDSPKNFTFAFLASFLAWGIECYITYVLIHGFSQEYGFSIALFVITFISLSSMIPSSSVFIGPYQYAYILALGIYHIDKSSALGIAFIHQFVIMTIITLITIVYFVTSNKSIETIKEEIEDAHIEQ